MKKGSLSVHSENILPIIKKWLYSSKEIFLRELVSNATDAIQKRLVLQGPNTTHKISVQLDSAKKTLTISDTGLGMTEEEVEKYIAQIAFSGAEAFVSKYQEAKEAIIGHFGLGFYSAYMVAQRVEIETLSYLPDAKPVFWSCDGSSDYSIGAGSRTEVGTSIILHLDEENQTSLKEAKVRELLSRYCSFLPFPIDLNGQPLNNQDPLWLKNPTDCTQADYLSFYRNLFPMEPEPLFWIHLNVEYPFRLKGILYFPKRLRRFEQQEKEIRLYCNRVFVSDQCTDILPEYLTLLRGAIDSPDIPLNVSRSYLQVDQQVKQLSTHIAKKVADRLVSLYKTERDAYIAAWDDVEPIVKLGLLQDEKFSERIQEALIWKTTQSSWTTIAEIRAETPDLSKIYYSLEEGAATLQKLYKGTVICANSGIDTAVLQHLENKLAPLHFQRIDSELADHLLDPTREKSLLDADGKSESTHIADIVRRALDQKDLEVEAKSLSSDQLHGVILFDEQNRRLRDYLAATQGAVPDHFHGKRRFVINTNSPLVQALSRLNQPLATELAQQLYDLARLNQREVSANQVEELAARQARLLEALVKKVES